MKVKIDRARDSDWLKERIKKSPNLMSMIRRGGRARSNLRLKLWRIKKNLGLMPLVSVGIEPTNHCNLNCPFCLVGQQSLKGSLDHNSLNRPMGFMDLELFNCIIRNVVGLGVKSVLLHFQGEPLLHRDFFEMVRISKHYGLVVRVFTNGLLLNEDKCKKLIEAGLDEIMFSIDGATEETYQLNRVGGNFDKAYENMRDLALLSRQNGSKMRISWQFIAMRNNEHEISMAEELAKKADVKFVVKSFAETDENRAPVDPKIRRKLMSKPCIDIYRSNFIYWDGSVVPCCYDLEGAEVMGNIKKNTLKEIWDCEKYRKFRQRVDEALIHPENEPELCRDCLKYAAHGNL